MSALDGLDRWAAFAATVDAKLGLLRATAEAVGADPGAAVARAVELHRTTGLDQLAAIDRVSAGLIERRLANPNRCTPCLEGAHGCSGGMCGCPCLPAGLDTSIGEHCASCHPELHRQRCAALGCQL